LGILEIARGDVVLMVVPSDLGRLRPPALSFKAMNSLLIFLPFLHARFPLTYKISGSSGR
jgi:hypothetical protein